MFARTARKSLFVLLLAAATGWGPAGAQPAKETTAPKDRPGGWSGSVSEEQFKAMHELETAKPPALHGQMIDLAGGHASAWVANAAT